MSSKNYQAVLDSLISKDDIAKVSSKCTEWDNIFHEITQELKQFSKLKELYIQAPVPSATTNQAVANAISNK